MITAMLTACGLWGISWMMGKNWTVVGDLAALHHNAVDRINGTVIPGVADVDGGGVSGDRRDAVPQTFTSLYAVAILPGAGGGIGGNDG